MTPCTLLRWSVPAAFAGLTGMGLILQTPFPSPASLARYSLSFEPNRGQAAASVKFLARGPRYDLLFSDAGLTIVHPRHRPISLKFLHSTPGLKVDGLAELPERTNYLIGADPTQWITGIPTYRKVRYRQMYPGVDLVFYGTASGLEYDLVVSAGVDPGTVRLAWEGVDHLALDTNGDLIVRFGDAELRQQKPRIYQENAAILHFISGRNVIYPGNSVGFETGLYDRSIPLVIDPLLSYASYAGGTQRDEPAAIAVDSTEAAHIIGTTRSMDFPISSGAFQNRFSGGFEKVFITKYNPAGTAVVFSTWLGGENNEQGTGIAIDAAGNIYVSGTTFSQDFPVTPGALQQSRGAEAAGFIAKLSPAGDRLVYSTYLRGASRVAIAVDPQGSAYAAGWTSSREFPSTPGSLEPNFPGNNSGFVAKLNPSGSALTYSTFLGTFGTLPFAVTVDSAGNAYVTGETSFASFPVTSGAAQRALKGSADAFVTKLNSSGSALIYSTFLGGGFSDRGSGIAVTPSGDAYVTGYTFSLDFPTTPFAFQTAFHGTRESGLFPTSAFVTRLNATGTEFVYSTYLGGSRENSAEALTVDSTGSAHVAGRTTSRDFPVTGTAFQSCSDGSADAFVARLSPNGSSLLYASFLGGSGDDAASGIALDRTGNVYMTGSTDSTDFPVSLSSSQRTLAGASDGFVAKIDLQIQAPSALSCIVNGASLQAGPIAPGTLVSLFGTGIGPAQGVAGRLNSGGALDTTVAETRVLFDGVAAPLIYAHTNQVNAVAPYSLAGKRTASVQVEYRGNRSNSMTVVIAESAPAIFTVGSGTGPAAAINQEGTVNSRSNPAILGSVLTVFATGAGETDPPGTDGKVAANPLPKPKLPVSVRLGSDPLTVLYAGAAPGLVEGVLQVNVQLRSSGVIGNAVPLELMIGTRKSAAGVTVAVQPPLP